MAWDMRLTQKEVGITDSLNSNYLVDGIDQGQDIYVAVDINVALTGLPGTYSIVVALMQGAKCWSALMAEDFWHTGVGLFTIYFTTPGLGGWKGKNLRGPKQTASKVRDLEIVVSGCTQENPTRPDCVYGVQQF